jgi:hypothetical protein
MEADGMEANVRDVLDALRERPREFTISDNNRDRGTLRHPSGLKVVVQSGGDVYINEIKITGFAGWRVRWVVRAILRDAIERRDLLQRREKLGRVYGSLAPSEWKPGALERLPAGFAWGFYERSVIWPTYTDMPDLPGWFSVERSDFHSPHREFVTDNLRGLWLHDEDHGRIWFEYEEDAAAFGAKFGSSGPSANPQGMLVIV